MYSLYKPFLKNIKINSVCIANKEHLNKTLTFKVSIHRIKQYPHFFIVPILYTSSVIHCFIFSFRKLYVHICNINNHRDKTESIDIKLYVESICCLPLKRFFYVR